MKLSVESTTIKCRPFFSIIPYFESHSKEGKEVIKCRRLIPYFEEQLHSKEGNEVWYNWGS